MSDSKGLFSRDVSFLIDAPADAPEDSGEQLQAGESRTFDGIEFIWIPPGEFRMGSTGRHADSDEEPVTRVRISQGYWLGKYEVTQEQWESVMGSNPSRFNSCGGNCPVEMVSWNDVQKFIRKLNSRSGGSRYRLPTEAEWEYAARAGTRTDTYAGDLRIQGRNNAPLLDRIAWYGGNSGVSYDGGRDCSDWKEKQYRSQRCGTHPVGGKAPNAWGLHDMLGNVWEWVGDWKRGLSRRDGDGSRGAFFRLVPGQSGRRLYQQRRGLPVGESRPGLAGQPRRRPGLPPAEEVITLGPITLLPLAARSARWRAGRREGRAPQRPSRAEDRPPRGK